MSDASSFSAGFAARHDAAAHALHQAYSKDTGGFAPADLKAGAKGKARPKSFSPQESGPKSFSPADPTTDPTQGWDPLNPQTEPSAFIDLSEAARQQGFDDGVMHGRDLQRIEHERDIALLQSLAQALKASDRVDRDQFAQRLRETVLALVTKLVGDIGIAPAILAVRIKAAVDLLADSVESATLRVNPDDIALLQHKLPATLSPVADASIERGGFVLESAATIVEEGPDLWLGQLAHAIDRVAVPAC